jgi:hypothetical protein
MGHKVIKRTLLAGALCLAAFPSSAIAQAADRAFAPAVGADTTYSIDGDHTEVLHSGLNFDLKNKGPEDYLGVRVEHAAFNPLDRGWIEDGRVYVRAASHLGRWNWSATAGTDGDTVLGSASLHDSSKFRKELFVEREILETPRGLSDGLYYTFVGAAIDLPADDRNVVTLVSGLQDVTGRNQRLHVRGTFVHVLKPTWGLSAQLRVRWFHNSDPREFDYYSPRWYAQVLPILQMRRTTDAGWRFLAAGGVGAQRDSGSRWHRSSYLNGQATSPPVAGTWALTASVQFSETPPESGSSYTYFQTAAGVVRRF